MKHILKVAVGLIVLFVAYEFGTHLVTQSDEAVMRALPESQWVFHEEIDPVTKRKWSRALAHFHTQSSIGESTVEALAWDCADGTPDSLRVELTTFFDEKGSDGNLKPYPQDGFHSVDYRFDGIPASVSTSTPLAGATIRREYSNSVQLFPTARAGRYGRHHYPGLYTTSGNSAEDDSRFDTKSFYIVDPEFVARIPVAGGTNVVVQFSLDDPALKRLLIQCGLTYGPVPTATAKQSEESGLAVKIASGHPTKPLAMPPEEVLRTNIRIDPNHPLKIGNEYYPEESRRNGEEGRCVVRVSVSAKGLVTSESIKASTGFPRLDEACLGAVRNQRLIPATENGKPVERSVEIPIVWTTQATR